MSRTAASTPAVTPRPRTAARGFNAMKDRVKETAKSKDFGTFTVDYDKKYVVAFMENVNFDVVGRHWVDTTNDEGRPITVPRNCIAELSDAGCPLCGVGIEVKPLALFNIVDLDDRKKVQLWEVSSGIFDKIVELSGELASIPEDRGGPLELNSPGVYAVISKKKKETKSGKGGFTEYTITRVKERDLDEDYALDKLSDEEYEALVEKIHTPESIQFNTVEELRDLASKRTD